jgi:hypothetical protein
MAFKDYDEFAADGALRIPIRGKLYLIPDVDAKTGLYFERLLAAGVSVHLGADLTDLPRPDLDDDQERTLYQRALGTAYDEMMADGCPWPAVKRAGVTAFLHVSDPDLAEKYWNSGAADVPPASAPNRAARRASTSTGAARTTRGRGSTSGTKSPRKS